jgi:transcriptional regulator with XRE-family HTH domain
MVASESVSAQTSALIAALKLALKGNGLKYADVAHALGVSEASIKRGFAQGQFNLERLEAICDLARISFFDLARLAETTNPSRPGVLTDAQEQALVDDPMLTFCFHLALGNWSLARIVTEYAIDEAPVVQAFARLDRLGLLTLLPGNAVRLTTQRSIEYRVGGPMRRFFDAAVKAEFLDRDFNSPGAAWEFEVGDLSEASRALINRRIGQLYREIRNLVSADAVLPLSAKVNTGILVAMTPIARPLMARDLPNRVRSK